MSDNNNNKTNWFLRLQKRNMAALKNSIKGIIDTIKTEPSFWQELIVIIPLIILSFFLEVTAVEQVLLVVSLLLIVFAELVNTAIEATIDRISMDRHDLSGKAKDAGSSAVFITFIIAIFTWVIILTSEGKTVGSSIKNFFGS